MGTKLYWESTRSMAGSERDVRKPRRCGLLGAAALSGPITLREDRHIAPYKSSRRPFRSSIFPLSSSSCITLRFSLAIHSFPSCRQATWFRWLLHAANQSQTAIPTDLSSKFQLLQKRSGFLYSVYGGGTRHPLPWCCSPLHKGISGVSEAVDWSHHRRW